MTYLSILLICVGGFHLAKSSILPIEKCNLKDSACMVSTAQKIIPEFTEGIPELGVDRLDVLEIDFVDFELSGFHFTLKNGKVKGLKNAVVDDIKWDVNKKRITLSFHVDCDLEGEYTAKGQLLLLPIMGDGVMVLKLKNYSMTLNVDYELKNVDGKDAVVLKRYEYDYAVKDGAHFDFTHFTDGNEQLGKTIMNVINNNWKELINDFGRPIIDVVVKKLAKNVSKFFKKNALTDLAIIS